AGAAFIERNRQWIRWKHVKVLLAIARCRTATLGGHVDQCTRCGHRATISYNSCRNRHCPKCQTAARERWIAARQKELLPTRYVHVVFTLPSQLARLALQNKKFIYGLLLQASAETLLEVARDQRHLGAEIGFFSVLHTWNQRLSLHPHVHCVIPAGGLSLDHTHWVTSPNRFFLPLKVLSRVFRGKFVAALKQAFQNGRLSLHGNLALLAQPKTFVAWLRPLFRKDWVVYAKRPFGFLANRRRATLLPFCFQLLGAAQEPQAKQDVSSTNDSHDLWRCPKCGGPMVVVEKLTAAEIQLRSPPLLTAA